MSQALGTTSPEYLLEQVSLRINAAGIPLKRTNVGFRILHPLYSAISLTWTRDGGMEPQFQATDDRSRTGWTRSPLAYLVEHRLPFIRRRLTGPSAQVDFGLLEDLQETGVTDYLGYFLEFSDNSDAESFQDGMIGSWATDRPGGFTDNEVRELMRVQQRLAVACKMTIREQITRNVLTAYMGPDAGRQVLNGQIQLGSGETIHAVIWFSDLRNSVHWADTLPADDFLALVNSYFECTAGAILDNEGEVLRFIGDAVLGIFPIRADGMTAEEACRHAMDAAAEAQKRLAKLNTQRKKAKQDPLGMGIGLHVGDVMYGNIGVPARMEFSVVGPAANEASRIEALTKELGHTVIVSDHFAEQLDISWKSLGKHELKGKGETMEVFAPKKGKKK